jgi:hypothetical protein
MSDRHTFATAEFFHPFRLAGVGGRFAAGVYDVETIDEPIAGLSFQAFRRVSTTMVPREMDPLTQLRQSTIVEPGDLDDALANDRAQHNASLATDPARDKVGG